MSTSQNAGVGGIDLRCAKSICWVRAVQNVLSLSQQIDFALRKSVPQALACAAVPNLLMA